MNINHTRGPIPEGRDTHFEFPTDYPLKVAGENSPELEAVVVEIVRRHVEDFDVTTVTARESKGGKYLAVSLVFIARSKKQLDSIYIDLTSDPRILWAL